MVSWNIIALMLHGLLHTMLCCTPLVAYIGMGMVGLQCSVVVFPLFFLVIGSCFPGMQDVFTCNFSCWVPNLCNVFSLFLKSLRNTARNPRNLLSLFIIPLIQLYFISNAAGRLPNRLKVGFINDDVPAGKFLKPILHCPSPICLCCMVVVVTKE